MTKRKLPGACLLLLLVLPRLALALDPSRAVTQYRLDQWTTRTGLPVMSVLCLLQDRAGYLWMGTQEGLARFDGVTFRTFKFGETPGLAGNYISALFEDHRGRIWAGTDAGDLSYFDGAAFSSIPRDGPLRGQVAGFAEGPDGALFVAFRGVGLRRLVDRRLVPVADREGRPIERLGTLVQDVDGEIWAGGQDRLLRFAQGSWSSLPLPQSSGRLVTALAVGTGGEILLSTDDLTLQRLRPRGRELVRAEADRPFPAPVRALRVDRERTLWIGTEAGLSRWRPGEAPEPVVQLPEATVNVLAEDREGGLWIGTNNNGLVRLTTGEALPFGTAEGLPHPNTWNVFASSRGDLWVTTSGGLARIAHGRVERVTVDGLPGEDVVALAERRDGSLWMGTFRNGLYRLPHAGAPLLHYQASDGLPPGPITVVFEDSRGTLWVGSREGLSLLQSLLRDGFQPLRLVAGTVQPYISSIVEDHDGTVWIATNIGLFADRNGRIRRYGQKEGLADTALNALLVDRNGTLWIATNGEGLQVFDGGRFRTVDHRHGLSVERLLWLVEDGTRGIGGGNGALWMSSGRGILRADRQALLRAARGELQSVDVRRFDFADGLRDEECSGTGQPAGAWTRDGRIWFPTNDGVVAFDPPRIATPVPPSTALDALLVDGRDVPAPSGAELSPLPDHRNVEIRFTALVLDEAAGTSFRYRLEGYDADWIEAGQRRSAYYTHLAPGSYRFQVEARHKDGGPWSAPASLRFRFLPRLYETLWARTLFVILAAVALYGGVRWRSRRLEQRIAERTAELSRANASLVEAAEHQATLWRETESARQRAETAQREAEHLEREARSALEIKGKFLATVSHELRTPLHGILGLTELMRSTSLDERQRQFIEIIHRSGEILLGLVTQILDLTQSDRGKLTLAAEPFLLADCFQEAVALVAPTASAKGLDLSLSIEPAVRRQVIGDRTRVSEIATNLLGNAVKFTETGSVHATVRAQADGGRLTVTFAVTDTGIGIAPEHQSRIFQPFEQVDSSYARRHGGAGLGLAIANQLCSWMGGSLSVESAPGQGSTFTATIVLEMDPSMGNPAALV